MGDTSIFGALISRADHAVAAIDWCEENYVVSDSIAEWWNTISSLQFVAFGMHAWYRAYRLRLPVVHHAAALLMAGTGLASAYFHATLLLAGQRADEVFENATLAALLHGASCSATSAWRVALHIMVASAGILTVSAFLFTELHLIITAVLLTVRLSNMTLPITAKSQGLGHLYAGRTRAAALMALCGALAWLVDRTLCSKLSLLLNPQLHAWWHVFGSFALHEAAACAAIVHCVLVEDGQSTTAPGTGAGGVRAMRGALGLRVRSIMWGSLTVVERHNKDV